MHAWQAFFDVNEPLIRRVIKRYARRQQDRDDLFQEAWGDLIVKIPELRYDPNRGSLRGWIVVVARHAAIRAARRLSASRFRELTAEIAVSLIDPSLDPVVHIDLDQQHEWARSILFALGGELGEVNFRITALHVIHGMSVSEIAIFTDLSKDRVRMRLKRSLGKLRRRLNADKIQERC